MTSVSPIANAVQRQDLLGQTVLVIGGSSGIGLETAKLARANGAEVILVARDPVRLQHAAKDVGARETASVDINDLARLERFFADLSGPLDHVMVTGPGPYYAPLAEMDFAAVQRNLHERILVTLAVARFGGARMRPPGTLVFMSGASHRRADVGTSLIAALGAATPALVANLALELAPIRANVIAAGFVDTPLSASLLGDRLEGRRADLRSKLPIRRVVTPADIAALAVHLMTNTAITGATYDIDGGQQLVSN